jgi:hypothetical protein
MPAIVIGAFLLQAVDGIINVFKYWREVTTVRFWIVSVVLALVCVAALKLR